jgi:hypothetical protein
MGTFLLHNTWVHFYLLYVGALSVIFIWDCLRPQPATRDGSRTPRNEAAHGAPGLFPSAANQNPPRSVSTPGRRTDKEVEPLRAGRRLQVSTDPTPAPSSRDRREYHVVTP